MSKGSTSIAERLVVGTLAALAGVIKIVLLFGILVGLVAWAGTNPGSFREVMAAVAGLGVSFLLWLVDLLQGLLDRAAAN